MDASVAFAAGAFFMHSRTVSCLPETPRMELTKRPFCKGLVNDARELRNVWSRMRNEVTLSEKKPSRMPKVLIKD